MQPPGERPPYEAAPETSVTQGQKPPSVSHIKQLKPEEVKSSRLGSGAAMFEKVQKLGGEKPLATHITSKTADSGKADRVQHETALHNEIIQRFTRADCWRSNDKEAYAALNDPLNQRDIVVTPDLTNPAKFTIWTMSSRREFVGVTVSQDMMLNDILMKDLSFSEVKVYVLNKSKEILSRG